MRVHCIILARFSALLVLTTSRLGIETIPDPVTPPAYGTPINGSIENIQIPATQSLENLRMGSSESLQNSTNGSLESLQSIESLDSLQYQTPVRVSKKYNKPSNSPRTPSIKPFVNFLSQLKSPNPRWVILNEKSTVKSDESMNE